MNGLDHDRYENHSLLRHFGASHTQFSKNPRPSCHHCDQRVPLAVRPSVRVRPSVCQSRTFRGEERYRISLMQAVGVPSARPPGLPRSSVLGSAGFHITCNSCGDILAIPRRRRRRGARLRLRGRGRGRRRPKARVGEKEKREAAAAETAREHNGIITISSVRSVGRRRRRASEERDFGGQGGRTDTEGRALIVPATMAKLFRC